MKNDDSKTNDGPVRRPLIRASLPHPEGETPSHREAPVFTMHEQTTRGNTRGKQGGRNGTSGNVQPKKHNRRRGGQGRNFNDKQASGNHSNGNQSRPEGRPGGKTRSSRRGRGRSK